MNSRANPCEPSILLSIIERFTCIGEAEAAVTALEAAAIDATVFDDEIVRIDWMYSNAVGGVKVVVRDEDYDAAADVLDFPAEQAPESVEEPPSEPAAEELEASTQPQCPSCGSTSIGAIAKFRVFAALAVLIAAVGRALNQMGLAAGAIAVLALILALAPSHFCRECGERFNWSPPRKDVDESPLPQDLIENHCPRCGSTEIYHVARQRFTALTMFQPLFFIAALWPFMPKWECDACGYKSASFTLPQSEAAEPHP